MQDWNVIITVQKGGFKRAINFFKAFGPVSKTGFYNVLVSKVTDVDHMMQALNKRISENPDILTWLARVIPVTHMVDFQTGEELESRTKEILHSRATELAGKGFHIRVHRRGLKGIFSGWETEKRLDEFLLQELEKAGTPGRIDFQTPDAVILIETLGPTAGLSYWTSEDLKKYPLLGFSAYLAEELEEQSLQS
jgi:tRNA(Ser,Leu) C12 N-acetylase TAN1